MIALAIALGGCGRLGFDASIDAAAFRFRQRIDVRSSKLASGVDGPFPLFARVGGSDPMLALTPDQLRFVAADGVTPLPFELEAPLHGGPMFDAWIRLPALTNGVDQVLYAMWGDPDLAGASSPRDVFGPPFAGVWHMADASDSTRITTTGTFVGGAIVDGVAGLAHDMTGGGYMYAPAAALAGLGADGTASWSAWVRVASTPVPPEVTTAIGLATSGTAGNDFRLGTSSGGGASGEITLLPGAVTTYADGGVVPIGAWTQVAMVLDATELRMYVNGALESRTIVTGTTLSLSLGEDVLFGIDCNSCGGIPNADQLDGVLDETRIYGDAMRLGWFAAEYAMLSGNLVDVGAVEAL